MAIDRAHASDGAAVRVLTKAEAIRQARAVGAFVLEGRARLEKYHAGETTPYEVIDSEPNLFLTAGITNLWNLATGQSGTAWGTGAYLAVGSSTTAANASNTSLGSQLTGGRRQVDAAPTVSGNSVTFTATFPTSAANGAWEECGVVTASSGGTFLNRLVQSFGTKTSSAQWVLSLTLSISSS